MIDRFWNAFESSKITTFCITLGVVCTVCYLAAQGQEVPKILEVAFYSIFGWFAGVKGQVELVKHYRARAERAESASL